MDYDHHIHLIGISFCANSGRRNIYCIHANWLQLRIGD